MTRATLKTWQWVHRWSSIVATLFLLMLCVTGLPLIFHDEIDALAGDDVALAGAPSAVSGVSLDRLVADATGNTPGHVPLFIGFSQDSPLITVTTGPSPDAAEADMRLFSFDRTSGAPVGEVRDDGIMHLILRLHVDMFMGLPGMIFLGTMGLLMLVAIVSGVLLYVPVMRAHRFGTLRMRRGRRIRWLDQHNLLGIVTLGWALVVGGTGAINAFADPLVAGWRTGQLQDMTAGAGDAVVAPPDYASLDRALAAAKAAQPGLSPQFIAFPGGAWSSKGHYAVFFQGATPLTSHLLTPALIDARTATLTDSRAMTAMMQALMLSKPLHFGDYGGLPLKIIWALLDVATIWVLASGLLLWLGGKRPVSAALEPIAVPAE